MTSNEAIQFIVKLAGFKLVVRANRFGCDNDLAREAHDMVIMVLDGLRGYLGELIDLACALARETDPVEKDDLAYHLRQVEFGMEREWYDPQPYPVGDWRAIEGDGSFFNPVTGQIEVLGELPFIQPIPAERLCGLPAILDEIRDECFLTFDREIIFYWKRAKDATPVAASEPFDPDAEIPW